MFSITENNHFCFTLVTTIKNKEKLFVSDSNFEKASLNYKIRSPYKINNILIRLYEQ